MTVNSTLMKAILSMDAYNRGYGAGINIPSDKLGVVSILKTTAADGKVVNFDSSVLVGSDGKPLDQPNGFYGIAYQLPGGEKVISYRGTDNLNVLTGDPATGWGLGGGSTSNAQGEMAIKFYQSVAGAGSANWLGANISLTGHSLGGGLAGLVGANDNFNITKSQVM